MGPAWPSSAGCAAAWGSWEGWAWPSGGPIASCSRIQSNYLALQRINQELEDKLYRMVRATPKPTALPVQELGHRPSFLRHTPPTPPHPHQGWAYLTLSTLSGALSKCERGTGLRPCETQQQGVST